MLDHLHRTQQIESPLTLRVLVRFHVFQCHVAIVDRKPALFGVPLRDKHRFPAAVDGGNFRPQPRQRLAHKPAATAYIQDAKTRRQAPARRRKATFEQLLAKVAHPRGLHLVQHQKSPIALPPP